MTMDSQTSDTRGVRLHNVKFYNLAPRAIQCLAFNKDIAKIAMSRTDTTIEIWNVKSTPFMERTIVGNKKSSIEAMSWVGPELLTAGLTGQVSHWDLTTLRVKQSLMVTGSSIWCMDTHGQTIAVGTEEGYLNICELDTEMESLRYVKILDKQDGRILCCKFDKDGQHLVTGSLDVLRVWDVNSGHVIHKMATGRAEAKKETVIWSILILKDFKIATADSRGRLTIWDGKMGSQVESHQCLKADALCLATNEEQNRIFVSGIEPTVCSYNYTQIRRDNTEEVWRWVKTSSYYSHTHDVKALVVNGDNLISGGMDGYLVFTGYTSLETPYQQYGPLLQSPSAVVTDNRQVLLKYPNYVELWNLGSFNEAEQNGLSTTLAENPKKVLELLSRGENPLVCAAMSANGKWLTYCTTTHIRLFLLQTQEESEKPDLIPVKPHIPDHYSSAAKTLFSPDSKQLFLYKTTTGEISIFEVFEENQEIDFKQNISLKKYTSDLVHLMEISKCGTYLIVASLCNNVIVFIRKEEKVGKRTVSKWHHHMTLPQYSHPATAMTTHPTETNSLVVCYANNNIIIYDLNDFKFNFSAIVQGRQFVTQNLVCDPKKPNSLIMQNEKELLVLQVRTSDSENGVEEQKPAKKNQKRAKTAATNEAQENNGKPTVNGTGAKQGYTLKVLKEANELVHLDWLGEEELVSVEITSATFLEQLPPTLKLKKYGTG